ncbi:MAG: DNA repair protein RecN [Paludibacter sp.]|jgi:DNA repair protein RecN (Recombination protein N)|nr:DNA repair protein RecN [Paludibacter sp.]
MLKSLYISNYALISELHIDFNEGFSVLTGETGAGKSIILGALSLILGQRADTKAIKTDSDKCIIEAEFNIEAYPSLTSFFNENDLDQTSSKLCLIRREITGNAKSRAFINDTPVSLNVLRELTSRLIDIHSQHDNLLLGSEGYQLGVVDMIAQNSKQLLYYSEVYTRWQNEIAELKKLENMASKQSAELDFVRFQFNQLNEAALKSGEQEELEAELQTLSHAEEIKIELQASVILLDEEKSILPMIKEMQNSLSRIKKYVPEANEWLERIDSVYIDLKDICNELNSFADKVEYNPQRLEWVQNRLSDIYTLQKKYKADTTEELIRKRDEFDSILQRIDSFDEEIESLKHRIAESKSDVTSAALKLSETRRKATKPIADFLVRQLKQLGMPNIRFEVEISTLENFGPSGNDEVQFLFSANKNRDMQAVQLIASGGEISRLMLSIKYLVANKSELPTIIFDEIDTGVSGEIADRMGEIMQKMGEAMQVITITHLPQIAAKSSQHFLVYKDDKGLQTQTYIRKLTAEERITQLAQMLSGKQLTEASVQNAKDLLGFS